jgi:hypothetical protein
MPPLKAFHSAKTYPLGDFDLVVGDYKTPGGLVHVGPIEGDGQESAPWVVEKSTASQYTGGVAHDATVTAGEVTLSFGVIGGISGIMAALSPVGSQHVGGRRRKRVTEKAAWLVPRALFDAFPAGFTWDGAVWNPVGVPSAPEIEFCAFYPRCYFMMTGVPRPFAKAGMSVLPVILTAMVDFTAPQGAVDAGADVICRGNPALLYPAFRVGS